MSKKILLRKILLRKKEKQETEPGNYLSSGSTLFNMACTGNPAGAFIPGKYYFLVGDSSSGKTFLSLTCFAEAANNPAFKNYRLIYDNSEDGALMDFEKYFGKNMASKLEPPAKDKEGPLYSTTIEDFYYHVDDAVQQGQPFIYILDSMDSLSSESESDKFQEQKEAFRKGKDSAGSYGDGKAKKNSSGLRRILYHLRETGSILIIINQTRDNISGMGFEKKTRSGGHALRFYATLEIWLAVKGKITKTIQGKTRQLGITSQVKVKKNRITGKDRTVEVNLYHSHGIDDLGTCIQYLLSEGTWKKTGSKISAPEFEFEGREADLIKLIEENNSESILIELVQDTWENIEKETQIIRKKKYE